MRPSTVALALAALCLPNLVSAQTTKVTHKVHLRPDPSSEYAPIRLLTTTEPPLTLLDHALESGYCHVKTTREEEGYVWGRYVSINTSETVAPESIHLLEKPVPGSACMAGCGDGLWHHVYHPSRQRVSQDCITVTGTIVDATAHQSHHQADGIRHEGDGDTHGWLQVHPQFANLINDGNKSNEEGNLVFELVCHYKVTQQDAKPSCAGYHDTTAIPTLEHATNTVINTDIGAGSLNV